MRKKLQETDPIVWIKGLAAAVIGGALGGAAKAVEAGTLDPVQLRNHALLGAAMLVSAYFIKSPLTPTK